MSEQIGIRELRQSLTQTVRRVRRGESFVVTHDGEPVAMLTPLPENRLARLVAAGEVTLPKEPFRLPERTFPITGAMSASEALERDRGD